MMFYRLARPLLFLLAPELAHAIAALALRLLGWLRFPRRRVELPVEVAGLRFPNPIGLAAGFDKDATCVRGLWALGFGAVEIGTVTPRPQPGNPRPRVFRLPAHRALINRMGFNNAGAARIAARLARLPRPRPAPLGVNLGKNRDTPLDEAVGDYVAGADALAAHADYLVVNASSPNTPGLRALQEPDRLAALLRAVRARSERPLFLKIAPDLDDDAIDAAVDVAIAEGAAGLIATNTTVERPVSDPRAGEAGGLSGAPLAARSTHVIRRAYRRAAGRLAIIGVGGIFTADDAYAKIRAGASLLQVYTGLIYEGPALVARLVAGLRERLARDGLSLPDAVGRDAFGPNNPRPPVA
jgi:dihydroorotate dehydrogenase